MPHIPKRCITVSCLAWAMIFLTSLPVRASAQERISKYGSIEAELERLYHPRYAALELERFKAGGMAWARDIEFFGLVTVTFHGLQTADLLDRAALQDFLGQAVESALPGIGYRDILSPRTRDKGIDFAAMGTVDVSVWLVPGETRIAYYIDFNACKEQLEDGAGGRWYEYALGMADRETIEGVIRQTLSSMTDHFAADFTFVRKAPPVEGYLKPYAYPGLNRETSGTGTGAEVTHPDNATHPEREAGPE